MTFFFVFFLFFVLFCFVLLAAVGGRICVLKTDRMYKIAKEAQLGSHAVGKLVLIYLSRNMY